MKIMTAGKQDYPEHLRMLVVGESGVGKTDFACSAPNPLFISFNESSLPVLSAHGLRYINANSEKDLLQVKAFLTEAKVPEGWGPIETLVIDDLEELQRKLFIGKLAKEKRSDIKRDDWNWISQRMNAILSGLNEIPINIIYLSSAKVVQTDDELYLDPALQGSISNQIHNYVDVSALLVNSSYSASVDSETLEELEDEVELEAQESRLLITVPCSWARWPKNNLLKGSISEVHEYIIYDMIDEIHKVRDGLPDNSMLLDSDSRVEEEAPAKDEPKEINIPGMSTASQIEDLLNKKDESPSTQKKKGALVYGTNA